MEEAWVKAGSKAAQGIRFSHAGSGSKNTDAANILQIVQAVCHLCKVSGDEMILFFELLFVKRIKRKSVKRIIHQALPPACE